YHVFNNRNLSEKQISVIFVLVLTLLLITLMLFHTRILTVVSSGVTALLLSLTFNYKREVLKRGVALFVLLMFTFLFVLLFGNPESVWFDDSVHIGIPLFGFPVECLLLLFSSFLFCAFCFAITSGSRDNI